MPRYYCDYCDAYLTHDSASVRRQHNVGFKHKARRRAGAAGAAARSLPYPRVAAKRPPRALAARCGGDGGG